MITCLALTPAIDRLIAVDRLVPGAVHRPPAAVAVPGGKGLNAARAAAALGAEVQAVAALAGDLGRWMAAGLHREGVSARIVWTGGDTRVCTSVADGATSSLTEFYEESDPLEPAAWEAVADRTMAAAAEGGWLAVSGSLPPGVEAAQLTDLVTRARAARAAVALDTHGPALPAGLSGGPELVKVNAAEAAEVAGSGTDRMAQAEELRRMAGGTGHAVVVTHGSDGLVAVDEGGRRYSAAVDARGPYPVGSGDACLAGLLVELDAGAPWEAALRLAVGAAAANAELPGAGRLARARARELAGLAAITP